MTRWRTAAWASLALLALPGLTFLIDRLPPLHGSDAGRSVARLLVLVTGAVLLLRLPGDGDSKPALLVGPGGWISILVVVAATAFVWLHPAATVGVVLLAATVEEVLFRQQLPAVVGSLLRRYGLRHHARIVSVLLSQLSFAASHFVVVHHPAPFAGDAAFVRLLAAGCFLAILYEMAGLVTAVAVHCLLNVWISTGSIGLFLAPPAETQFLCLVVAFVGVAGTVAFGARSHRSVSDGTRGLASAPRPRASR